MASTAAPCIVPWGPGAPRNYQPPAVPAPAPAPQQALYLPPHSQYNAGRVPTATSPSNTTSSSSSATGSQSGTQSTSLSNPGVGVPQLSRTNLYIRGLGQTTSDQDLVNMCYQYGTITSTKAILDKNTNKCKGYGFVDFETVSSAEAAVKGLLAKGIQAQMAKVGIWLQRRPNSQQEQDPTNLYMANLPLTFKENDVDHLLEPYGPVVSTRILRDITGASKGVGFARMETKEKCEQIIQVFNGRILTGAKDPLLVKFADGGSKKKVQYKTTERGWREPPDPTHQLLCSVAGSSAAVYGCTPPAELGVYRGNMYVGGYPVGAHWVPSNAYMPVQIPHMQGHPIDPEQFLVGRGGERGVGMGMGLMMQEQQYPPQLMQHALQMGQPQYITPHTGYGYMSGAAPQMLHAIPLEAEHSTAASPDEPYQPYPTK